MGFPGGSDGKESACKAGDLDSIPGLGRSSGGGRGNPLQYFCVKNPMDRGAWRATVHGAAKSRPQLSTYVIMIFSKSQNNLVPPSYHSVLPEGRAKKHRKNKPR